jgi:hypothetical protein
MPSALAVLRFMTNWNLVLKARRQFQSGDLKSDGRTPALLGKLVRAARPHTTLPRPDYNRLSAR